MRPFITESWLRESFSLEHGSEVTLPADARLTPSALALLEERKITANYADDAGKTVNVVHPAGKGPAREPGQIAERASDRISATGRVNPLVGDSEWRRPACTLCRQDMGKKPDTMTHLNMDSMVPKNDPRLKLRGKLDTLIARTVLIQEEFDPHGRCPELAACLQDIRSALGNALRAEARGEAMEPVVMGGLDAKTIHAVSHNPLRYIGIDHLLPESGHGLRTARLNLLRAEVREAELIAADIFIARDFSVTRPDIMEGLNRLSSAVYVLTLLTHLAEKGAPVTLARLRT